MVVIKGSVSAIQKIRGTQKARETEYRPILYLLREETEAGTLLCSSRRR